MAAGAGAGWEHPTGPAELQDGSAAPPPRARNPLLNVPARRERSCRIAASRILPELVKGREQVSDSSSQERFKHHLKT